MKRPIALMALAATLALASASSGVLADPPTKDSGKVDEAFGHTIVSTYPDGRIGKLWLEANGTYKAEGRRHDASSGHWTVNGPKLCLKQSKPMAVPIKFCTPIPEGGLSHAWSAKAVTGEDIRVQLVKGRA